MIQFILCLVSAFILTDIPAYVAPLNPLAKCSSAYDAQTSQILTFGGFDFKNNAFLSTLTSFDLLSSKWKTFIPQSNFSPPGLNYFKLYLRSDRKLLVFFGLMKKSQSSTIYSYNLMTDTWDIEKTTGDPVQGVSLFGFTTFKYSNTAYAAIYGGVAKDFLSDFLYLIDIDRLIVRKILSRGNVPGVRVSPTLVYYEKNIYLFGGNWPVDMDSLNNSNLYAFSLENEIWNIVNCNTSKPLARNSHFAYAFNHSMYMLYGTFGEYRFDEIWKFDFLTSQWILLKSGMKHYKFLAGDVIINSRVYLLYGADDQTNYSNSIDSYELSGDSLKYTSIVGNWISPTARKYHCSVTIAHYVYVFGGLSDTGEYLNDIWRYDIEISQWSILMPSGAIPDPRSSFGCILSQGTAIIIYGGHNSYKIFNDFYYYESTSNEWVTRSLPLVVPDPTFNVCICEMYDRIFITGGQNNEQAYSDIWLYGFYSNSFARIGHLPVPIINHFCWVELNENLYTLYLLGGSDFYSNPNNNFYKILIKVPDSTSIRITDSISTSISYSTQVIQLSSYSRFTGTSESAYILASDYVYTLFGSLYRTYLYNYIIKFNYRTLEMASQAFKFSDSMFGHSVSHYKKSFYVFGGGVVFNGFAMEESAINRFFQLNSNDSVEEIPCSTGMYGNECIPCPIGTYEVNRVCILCPAGRYSATIGANDLTFCLPCPGGMYSSKPGSSYCIDCPGGTLCPIGSSNPQKSIKVPEYQNFQPLAYTKSLDDVNNLYIGLLISFVIFGVFLTILAIVYRKSCGKLRFLDFLSQYHLQQLNVPVVYRKTKTGGIFFIYFALGALLISIGGIYSFFIDNITELRALVPNYTLNDTIKSEVLVVEVIAYLYGGICIIDGKCNDQNIVTSKNIRYDNENYYCNSSELGCTIRIEYSGVTFLRGSEIYLQLLNRFGFASALSINITVASSIPNEFSNVFIPIYPDSSDKVFKGLIPTVAYFELTSSIFTSESSNWVSYNTGYHITSSENPKLGSMVSQNEINSDVFVLVLLELNIAHNAFLIKRRLKATWLLFFGSLLGTLFGLMSTFGAIMSATETFVVEWKKNFFRSRVAKLKAMRDIIKYTLKGKKGKTYIKQPESTSHILNSQDF